MLELLKLSIWRTKMLNFAKIGIKVLLEQELI